MVLPIVPLISTGFLSGGGAVALVAPLFNQAADHDEYPSTTSSISLESSSTDNVGTENYKADNDDHYDNQNQELLTKKQNDELIYLRDTNDCRDTELYDHEDDFNQILHINLYELAKSRRWNDIIKRSKIVLKHNRSQSHHHRHHRRHHHGCDAFISLVKQKHKRIQMEESIINSMFESCLHNPPLQVISALLQMSTNPRALLMFQNNATKSTPLHIACYAGANLEVIQLLIDKCPEAVLKRNGIGWTPLHLLCWGTDDDEIAVRRKEPEREYDIARMLLLLHPQQQQLQQKQQEQQQQEEKEQVRMQNRSRYRCRSRSNTFTHQRAAYAIQIQDKIGWTPLHLACWGGASFDLIQLLLKSQKESASIRTNDGWTPVHLACRYSASVEIITALLDAAPQSATVKAKGGWCPLHLACWWKSSSQVIRAILRVYPLAASLETWEDYKPLEILWQRYLEYCSEKNFDMNGVPIATSAKRLSSSSSLSSSSLVDLSSNQSEIDGNEELCEKISLLLHAAHHRRVSEFTIEKNGPLPIIHGLAAIISNVKCPRQVKHFLMHQLKKTTKQNMAKSHLQYVDCHDKIIIIDRSLLSIAIENGITWVWGLETIFKASPEAIQIRDSRSGMYPFMQAATLPSKISSMDTIYNLLRASPCLVSR